MNTATTAEADQRPTTSQPRRLKKGLAVAAAILAFGLAACGDDDDSVDTGDESPPTSEDMTDDSMSDDDMSDDSMTDDSMTDDSMTDDSMSDDDMTDDSMSDDMTDDDMTDDGQ